MLKWLLRILGYSSKGPAKPSSQDANLIYTRPATWEDVISVARLLNNQGVCYVLVGGYALAAHGFIRMTEDIDIAVAPDPDNSKKWLLALSRLPDGAAKEILEEDDPFQGDYSQTIRINDVFTIDILPSVGGIPFQKLQQHSKYFDLDGETIPVLDLEGLLLTKQGLRPKDQADAQLLRQAIDRLKKESWAKHS